MTINEAIADIEERICFDSNDGEPYIGQMVGLTELLICIGRLLEDVRFQFKALVGEE